MGRDIFAEYIKGLQSPGQSSEEEEKRAGEVSGRGEGPALEVLREISRKLDHLSFAAVGESPSVSKEDDLYEKKRAAIVDLAVINGQVVLPDCGILQTDIYVKDGKIYALGERNDLVAKKKVDAKGKYVCPGIIDPHVHLGLFAPMETDMISETRAAVIGGITTTGVFLGGNASHFETFPVIQEQAERFSYTDIIPHLVIANEEQKREIPEYAGYLDVSSFKVYMNGIPGMIPSVDDGFIMDVFDGLKKTGKECVLCCHTENSHLVERALRMAKEKFGDRGTIEEWEDTHPEMAEEEAVMRISYLAEKAQMPVYLVHIGTKEGIERLRSIKPFNRYIHVESTSPYLAVAGSDRKDALYKMEPPLRKEEDKEALWRALEEGVIDTIGTDNVCATREEKQPWRPIWDVVPGYSVLQTHLPAVLTEGVWERGMDLERVIAHMTKRPAEIFGVYPKKGTLLPGSDADIVMIDMDKEKTVRAADLVSRSDFSIYEGRCLKGWPVMTIKGGKILAENGRLTDQRAAGHMLKR